MKIESIEKIERLPSPALGLLPAVHDAVVDAVSTVPSAAAGAVKEADGDLVLPAWESWPAQKVPTVGHLASDGRGWWPAVNKAGTSSYYPRAFERTLYTLAFSPTSLPLRKPFVLDRRYAFRLFSNNVDAVWNVIWEIGERTDATTPGTPGPNIAGYNWLTPLIDEQVHITDVASLHDFGVTLTRDLDGTDEVWLGDIRRYGATVAAPEGSLPTVNNFVLRLRLGWFDVTDNTTTPRGYVAYFVSDPKQNAAQ